MRNLKARTLTKKAAKPTRLQVRSRHPSSSQIRGKISLPYNAVYRHGSTVTSALKKEINSIRSVQTASSKLLMKQAFDEGGVKHLPWGKLSNAKLKGNQIVVSGHTIPFPVIIKSHYGSRGKGNYKIDTASQFTQFQKSHDNSHYIVEEYFSGTREYRIHITRFGAIYCLRKLLKSDTPKDKRWVRNNDTCVWIMQYQPSLSETGRFLGWRNIIGPQFDQPSNWDRMLEECKKALIAVGGDVMAVDLKVQSAVGKDGRKRKDPDFYIIEINSAPSFGQITAEVYKKELPKILQKKYG